jgi:hypothetical protein
LLSRNWINGSVNGHHLVEEYLLTF